MASVNFTGILKFYTENEPLLDRGRLSGFVRYAKEKLPGVKSFRNTLHLYRDDVGFNVCLLKTLEYLAFP